MIVTDIKRGKRGNSLLFCDNQYIMSVKTEVILKSGIKAGDYIDDDILEYIRKESNICKAQDKALNLLTYRGRSKKELKMRIANEINETAAEIVVKKMEAVGLINDANFARQYATELFNKKFSISSVRYKLREKGIDDDIIEDILSSVSINEEKQILVLLRNKFSGKFNDNKGKNRVISALNRLGYSFEIINRAFSLYYEGITEDELI